MNSKIQYRKLLPVLMAYIIMGFIDIVGVSTGYIKKDFGLQDDIAQLISLMTFIWFFILSVPVGLFQDKYGKRLTLNIGMAMTGLGMLIPFIGYSFPIMLIAFIFLGIGNTIVQVSANPLLQDVSPRDRFSSFMSLTQFIKAIISLLGPVLATLMATLFGEWKLIFAIYAITSFIAVTWLYLTRIDEHKPDREPATFKSCFSLMRNPLVALMVFGIFFTVGADVGMNTNIQNYLISRFNIPIEKASLGISLYFAALMISRFSGAIMLTWIKPRPFLIGTVLLALVSLFLMIIAPSAIIGNVAIFLVGLGSGNLFPLIFSITADKMPDRVNEISGLMIMAIAGGAFIPPIMGAVSQNFGVTPSLFVLVACMAYITVISMSKKTR